MAFCSIPFKLLALFVVGSQAADSKLADFLKENGKNEVMQPCLGDSRTKVMKGKCQHLGYRVCLRFLKDDDTPFLFGKYNPEIDKIDKTSGKKISDPNEDGLDWWEWSTQPENKDSWIEGMVKTGGHHWCACALCTAEAVTRFGCDKLDIKCDSSDIAFLRERVEKENKTVLKPGLDCLYKKCGSDAQKGWPIVGKDCGGKGCARLYEDGASHVKSLRPESHSRGSFAFAAISCAVAIGILIGAVFGVRFYRHASVRGGRHSEEALYDQIDLDIE